MNYGSNVLFSIMSEVKNLRHELNRLANTSRGAPRVGGTLSQRLGSWYTLCYREAPVSWPYHLPPGDQRTRFGQVNEELGGWLFSTAMVAQAVFTGLAFTSWDADQREALMSHLEEQRRQGIVSRWHAEGMALSATSPHASTWRAASTFEQGVTDFLTNAGSLQVPNHVPNTISGAVVGKFNPKDLSQ